MLKNLKIETIKGKNISEDHLRIQVKGKAKMVKGKFTTYRYRDVDTRQIVFFIPSLDITGYGMDEVKAIEMLKFSLNDFSKHITGLSSKKRETELTQLGWKHNLLKKKEFSKSFIDKDGELKNFNAVANEVEVCEVAL